AAPPERRKLTLTGRAPSWLFLLLALVAATAAARFLQSQMTGQADVAAGFSPASKTQDRCPAEAGLYGPAHPDATQGRAQVAVPAQTNGRPPVAAGSPYLNTRLGTAYVGSKVCATCHQDIYNQFERTDMGQSMSLSSDPAQLARVPNAMTIFDPEIHQYFQVLRKQSDIDQDEFAVNAAGQRIFTHTERLAYAVGAGENGYSYIIQRGDYLFQAPLSFYTKTETWGLSPGHELGFNRPITAGCIFCHSGDPRPVAGRDPLYHDPPFRELAIGCERCHGPGQLHVEARLKGEPVSAGFDPTIVNPARLPHWLADNICMDCHQTGDATVVRPGKSFLDFRPGTPLEETFLIFTLPLTPGSSGQSPLLDHYFLMRWSKCYRRSNGQLRCSTCHDPHTQPTPAAAPAYYRSRCLGCHSENSCPIPIQTRMRQTPPDNCIGCHMPRQKLITISHSTLTNHRIIARPGEPFPPEAELPTPGLQDLVELDDNPESSETLPPLVLAQAYQQLSAKYASYRDRYLEELPKAAADNPHNPEVLSMLARAAVLQKKPGAISEATNDLKEAIQLGSTWPPDYELLADLLARSGKTAEAVEFIEKGIQLSPYSPSFYESLAEVYLAQGSKKKAVSALQRGLELFPEDAAMRSTLGKLNASEH
ncbi:MAG: tetratricopeptide repeat protein, partial [Terriglobia bacterium]